MESASKQDMVVIFDFDGVIADSMDAYFGAFTEVCTEMGYNRLNSREAFLRLFEGNLMRQLLWAGFPLWRLKRLVQKFEPRIREAHREVRPFAGLSEVLSTLARDFPVYVITSNIAEVVSAFLDQHGFSGVSGVVGSDTHTSKVKKIRRVLRQHPGARGYYISDTKGDLVEARRAGAIPIAVSWGWHSVEKLAEGKPARVVASPGELREFIAANQ